MSAWSWSLKRLLFFFFSLFFSSYRQAVTVIFLFPSFLLSVLLQENDKKEEMDEEKESASEEAITVIIFFSKKWKEETIDGILLRQCLLMPSVSFFISKRKWMITRALQGLSLFFFLIKKRARRALGPQQMLSLSYKKKERDCLVIISWRSEPSFLLFLWICPWARAFRAVHRAHIGDPKKRNEDSARRMGSAIRFLSTISSF